MAKNTNVLDDFDLDALRRSKARSSQKVTDLAGDLRQISPDIENLNIGQTARIEIPGKNLEEKSQNLRRHVMSITAKLSNLTCKGGDWEGKSFETVSDGEQYVYVQRGKNLKGDDIPVRRRGGGRPKDSERETETTESKGDTVSEKDGALVEEHA